jgi:Asp-tRNA(Asn)/Glu-tRNA(Gln) amidotransferase A subunit family amidase
MSAAERRVSIWPPSLLVLALAGLPLAGCRAAAPPEVEFELVEATIADVHRAIQQGQITCRGLVEAYIARARAYSSPSDRLVTPDGKPIPAAQGKVLGGSPVSFPTETVAISSIVPDYDRYIGPPFDFGRLEPTSSDPEVRQQYGMTVGTPSSGQVNTIATLNLRGERSVTCKGDRDRNPSAGPLPAGAPAVCEEFRKQPDALERATQLDEQFGRTPDLAALPMYCVPFSFKDPFEAQDMRSTGAADARFDIDFPARDHTLVAQLRAKGAIIYAKALNTEYNGIPAPPPGGRHQPDRMLLSNLGYQRSSWSGNPANAYDQSRAASLGSSSGSGVSVSTNLVMCSICEETRMSCRGPANHNGVALILPQKALISFLGNAIGADIYNDRAGIHCRSVTDAAKVLDALKDPSSGYYDPRDVFTTIPRSAVVSTGYASHAAAPGSPGSLKGVRIGVIRESMVTFPGIKADEPISAAAAREIKDVLGGTLGATLVESVDPLWPDDPAIENMQTSYTRALAELVPVFFPHILFRLNNQGQPLFPEFAAAIRPTAFAPGRTFGSGTMAPADYMVALAEGKVPPPRNLNIRTVQGLAAERLFRFHIAQYLTRRAADWASRGQTETLADWPALNARSKFWSDEQRAYWLNWQEADLHVSPAGERDGTAERIMLRELLRRVEMKVIQENRLDVVVRLHTSLPPGKIGLAPWPNPPGDTRSDMPMGPNAGETEVLIPAGYVREVYDAQFALSADRRDYDPVDTDTPTMLPEPGLPFSLVFRAEPGAEDRILRVASAYEAASKRRISPPRFGPLRSGTN